MIEGCLIKARVLDSVGCVGSEQFHNGLIGLGEFASAQLIREVEVPQLFAFVDDGHAQKTGHRRMIGRESDRAWVLPDAAQAKRSAFVQDDTQDAVTPRAVADHGFFFGGHPAGDEFDQRFTGLIRHTQRGILRIGQPGRSLYNMAERFCQ